MTLKGLTSSEAKELLEKHGENKLKEKKRVSALKIFLDQFKSPLIYILLIAAGITLGLGDVIDAGVIGAAVLLNTILGFYQEMKAERSLEALSKLLTPKAKVIRDGKRVMIEASQVVPGDVCILEIGERVPADGVVIEATDLSLNEAILTGESAPVRKFSGPLRSGLKAKASRTDLSKVYMGTMVSGGIGKMRVEKTGHDTEVGKIADSLLETKEEKTPLQKQIGKFSQKLALMIGVICLIILVAGLLAGDPFVEIFTTSVAVAVSAIPEGLAVSLTIILAIGMQRIFKRKSLVKKLVAAETLGSVTVICADKTGTLTEGEMRVVKVLESINPDEKVRQMKMELLVKTCILCNDMRDPLEIGMSDWALKQKIDGKPVSSEKIIEKHQRLDGIPFDPKNRYIATVHSQSDSGRVKGEGNLLLVSGAPEEVLLRCETTDKRREEWGKQFEDEARQGHRLVGFAFKKISKKKINDQDIKGLRWLGCLVYEDPVRKGVKEALDQAKKAGIRVKVITGDYKLTAVAVLKQLGLLEKTDGLVMEGYELEKLSETDLVKKIDEVVLFARTNPEQKLKIVQALQNKGEVVAMTGDGVNDAPAIKKADIGIVVDEASAVAKETADMILLDSNFSTIVAAVEEGRGIFVNLRKIILYLLSDAFSEVILVLGSMVLGLPLPITAAQILWINLVDDGTPDFALTLEPKPKDLMSRKPKGHERVLMDTEIKLLIGLISSVSGLLALGMFWWYFSKTGDLILARTMAFTLLALSTLFYVFSCKSLKEPIWREDLFDNKWLWLAVGIGFSFQLAAIYLPGLQTILKTEPLGWYDWGVILLGSLVVMSLIEGVKWLFIKYSKD